MQHSVHDSNSMQHDSNFDDGETIAAISCSLGEIEQLELDRVLFVPGDVPQ